MLLRQIPKNYILSVYKCALCSGFHNSETHACDSRLPLNRGFIFQIAIGPREANWPNANSMKNNGKPTVASIITYGSKNAPV